MVIVGCYSFFSFVKRKRKKKMLLIRAGIGSALAALAALAAPGAAATNAAAASATGTSSGSGGDCVVVSNPSANITDNTYRIQTALDDAPSVPGGGCVRVTGGDFAVAGVVVHVRSACETSLTSSAVALMFLAFFFLIIYFIYFFALRSLESCKERINH